jgi:hypothetical protein
MDTLTAINTAIQVYFDNHPKEVTAELTALGLMLTTYLARYHIVPSNWLFIVARVIFGAVFDQVHPAEFKKLAAASRKGQLVQQDSGAEEQKAS